MKKKIISVVIAICLIIATVPTIVFASNSQSTSPIKIRVAPSEHEKPGWNVEWSESFEQGIPSTWQNIDNTVTATSGGKREKNHILNLSINQRTTANNQFTQILI